MKEVPMDGESFLNKEDNGATTPKKRETLETLYALADDYSEIIAEHRKVDNLYFSETVPQPQLFAKADKRPFCEDDCQKMIDGKYMISVEKTVDSKSDCISLVYEKLAKEEIPPPVKKKFTKPIEPAKTARITLFDREYKRAMERYKSELEIYEKAVKSAQAAYDKAMQDYERQVKAADEEYHKNCDELHKQVLSAIEEYIVACKEYFKRKRKVEEENDKQKDIIKAYYEHIVKKIQGYPDYIPVKFFKVSDFNSVSYWSLQELYSELKAYITILEDGRADTLKEAINCYLADKQAEEQKQILLAQAEEQREQAEKESRLARDQRRMQMQQSQKQTCAVGLCPTCRAYCHGMDMYSPNGYGEGCLHYRS